MSKDLHPFEEALFALKQNAKIRRSTWKDVVPSVVLYTPKPAKADKTGWPDKMFCQIRVGKNGKEDRVTWNPTITDIMAEDWLIESPKGLDV